MVSKKPKRNDGLNLTQEESESLGVAGPEEPAPIPVGMRERPLHEQTGWPLSEDEVTEALTGEVTPESREVVADLYADLQGEEADRQAE
jgi:hypothetical protein